MKRKLLTTTALIAFAIAGSGTGALYPAPAAAQTQSQTETQTGVQTEEVLPNEEGAAQENASEITEESATEMAEQPADEQAEQPATGTAQQPAAESETMEAATPESMAVDEEVFFVFEEADHYRSDKLLGASVFSSGGEVIGDINDLIVSTEGKFEGVIVGVGGFLGMGEKNVGVRFAALTLSEDPETNELKIVMEQTKESLEAAPAYVSKERQAVAAEVRQETGQTGVTTGAIPEQPADDSADPAAYGNAVQPVAPAQ
ncbi:PRC-barrel domain-containing protein [Oricola cellulosilytica]|uniref:PRC-barrel domain-containing protein n=1 Tax=Oricola cellulosilytica TaxID=1429082 RepID=A0A4V6N6C0_9HYPH|nr:PRC-barrel domain-containing protein [Oricola cellulosilytica]TCD15217.1 hypothetical protein E0D97_06645 [Oricola cellulosilytica]